MSRIFLCLLALAVLATPPAAAADNAAPEPRWPLDLPTRYLTSNFMEYRPGRFHAGLDLKTQTINGFAARAVEDGWVVRVRATPTAYGRAVYVRGESGRTYVYAHLSRFSDRLRGLVADQRARTGAYRARLEFGPRELPVRRGEVLGLTGESGTGGPHLHFEVRDAANRPIDPQAVGFAVGDTLAPVIHQLRAWPAVPTARVAGDDQEWLLAPDGGVRGNQPALAISGPVAFSARIVDYSDIRGHRLEPQLIEVELDGQLVYRCRNERYDFAENALLRLEWAVLPGVREHWLHRRPEDTLNGREGGLWYLGPDGQGLQPGVHELRVTASDRAGNTTTAQVPLVVAGPEPMAEAPRDWRPAPARIRICGDDSLSCIELSPFFDVMPEGAAAALAGLERREYRPAAGDPVMASMVVYSTAAVLDPVQLRAAADQGLRPLGSVRLIQAADWPVEASLPVRLRQPAVVPEPGSAPAPVAADSSCGLYRWDDDQWERVTEWPRGAAPGALVEVAVDQPGLHAVLADRSPPVFGQPAAGVVVGPGPISTVAGVTLPRWAVLAVDLRDLGAGLAAESIAVELDGRALIVEPDLPRDRILVEFPDTMATGPHRLVIAAADQAGNRARRVLEFQARD